jgi:hypothetical protein
MSAPGRIRTRDPLLRRHRSSVAMCRPVSPNELSSCTDSSPLWPGVAWRLRSLAPSLAPRACRLLSRSNARKRRFAATANRPSFRGVRASMPARLRRRGRSRGRRAGLLAPCLQSRLLQALPEVHGRPRHMYMNLPPCARQLGHLPRFGPAPGEPDRLREGNGLEALHHLHQHPGQRDPRGPGSPHRGLLAPEFNQG